MRTTPLVFLAALVGLLLGVGAGYVLFARPVDDAADSDRVAEVTTLREEVERLEGRLAEARRRESARPRVAVVAAPEDADDPDAAAAATGAEPAPAPVEDVAAVPTAEERAARVRALSAQASTWFERGDGAAAVAALRELAGLVPEGREAAMALAIDINRDVNGPGRLGLSDVVFYSGLGDPGVVALMDWALTEAATPSDFRVMAAYSLPWTRSPAVTLDQFGQALATERNVDVQRALVANLGRLNGAGSERLLAGLLADPGRDSGVRAMVAMQLASTDDAGILRTIETTAKSDENPAVRSAAAAALIARDPPASGYLVTGTLPSSQAEAAGLRAGDILVSYDGNPTRTLDQLRAATAGAEGAVAVRVVVVRDGREVEVEMRPGRLGVFGQAVEARDK